jgi:hypothetical protein
MPTRADLVRCGNMESPFGLKTGLELRVCKPPGVGASLIQDSKWEFRSKYRPRLGVSARRWRGGACEFFNSTACAPRPDAARNRPEVMRVARTQCRTAIRDRTADNFSARTFRFSEMGREKASCGCDIREQGSACRAMAVGTPHRSLRTLHCFPDAASVGARHEMSGHGGSCAGMRPRRQKVS